MIKRGKILRDTAVGPGLLSVDGNQHAFTLEGMWRSDTAPRIGMVADVNFDGDRVESVRAVPENQIAKEQAEQALHRGSVVARQIKDKFGLPAIVAFSVLIVGWFILPSVEIGRDTIGVQASFWQLLHVLGHVNALQNLSPLGLASSNMGICGLFALASLSGPFLSFFWHDRRAILGGLMPLLIMLLAGLLVAHSIRQAGEQAGRAMDVLGSSAAGQKMMQEFTAEFMSQFQIGIGVYVSLAACCYFAFAAVRKYLVAGA